MGMASLKATGGRGREGEITLLNAEPTVGSAPPWAGVTPAPSEKKSQNGEYAKERALKRPAGFGFRKIDR
jgi:hypothetical protein